MTRDQVSVQWNRILPSTMSRVCYINIVQQSYHILVCSCERDVFTRKLIWSSWVTPGYIPCTLGENKHFRFILCLFHSFLWCGLQLNSQTQCTEVLMASCNIKLSDNLVSVALYLSTNHRRISLVTPISLCSNVVPKNVDFYQSLGPNN